MTDVAFIGTVEALCERCPELSRLEAGLLAAPHLGLAPDTRSFARIFDVAHAHVLRALTRLDEAGLVEVTGRDPRTQRTRFVPTAEAHTLFAQAA
jgi:DNA-binding transcriptional ArsR family regulator